MHVFVLYYVGKVLQPDIGFGVKVNLNCIVLCVDTLEG